MAQYQETVSTTFLEQQECDKSYKHHNNFLKMRLHLTPLSAWYTYQKGGIWEVKEAPVVLPFQEVLAVLFGDGGVFREKKSCSDKVQTLLLWV